MIPYKKAMFICLLQYALMLFFHIFYAAFFCSREQFLLTLIWSGCIFLMLSVLIAFFHKHEAWITFLAFASVIFSAYVIGVILHTLAFAILMYLTTASILSMYLDKRYVLFFGIGSAAAEVSFIFFFPELLLEMVPSLFIYWGYIVCYIMGLINIYFLVSSARKYLSRADLKTQEAEIANEHKSRFVANISHEIRTPMNVIFGMAKILENMDLSEEAKKCADCITDSSKILLSLINDVLDLSKIESGKVKIVSETYSIYETLNAVEGLIRANLRNTRVRFVVEIKNSLPEFWYGDEARIRQILINLLNNAVKFTEKGEIRLIADWKEDQSQEAGKLIFQIKDTGIGIKREDQSRLFESFERLETEKHKEIEGSGLGLSICKNLVLLMKGELRVESDYGKGSTFFVEIPQKIAKEITIEKGEDEETGDWKAPGAKVLVVDDLVTNLAVAKGLLAFWDIKPDCVTSGKDALLKMEQQKYELVLLDHMMPDMDGEETLKNIREHGGENFQQVPVIALTANAEIGKKEEFKRLGFSAYIPKPIEPKRLERVLRSYLKEGNSSNEKEEKYGNKNELYQY